MELALPVEISVFPFTRWKSRTVFLGAVPNVVRVRAYTAFRLVDAVSWADFHQS
jgi:hypothetical protein